MCTMYCISTTRQHQVEERLCVYCMQRANTKYAYVFGVLHESHVHERLNNR